jgi:predicted O-methyltransferase YrrM
MNMPFTLDILLLVVLTGILLVLIYLLHKVRRVHLMMFGLKEGIELKLPNSLIAHFQQTQILTRLQNELGLKDTLPPLRGWAASPDFLLEIFTHARHAGPETILECSSGASTIVLARAAQLNGRGHVYSLEHEPVFSERTRSDLARLELADWATVIDAPLRAIQLDGKEWLWYATDAIPSSPIDLVVVDGPPEAIGHMARYPAGPLLLPKLSPGGAVFLDDANQSDERHIIRDWEARFSTLSKRDHFCEKGCVSLTLPTLRTT